MTARENQGVAIVTGAGGAIGRAIVRTLATQGFAVACVDRDADAAGAVARVTPRATAFTCDVSSESSVEELANAVQRTMGDASLLVNAAGVFYLHDLVELSGEGFDEIIGVNLRGTFLTCKAFIPQFVEQGGGTIVNIASTAGLRGGNRRAIYSASKAGVLMLTRSIAIDYGPRGVRANCVCPGLIDTPMADWLHSDAPAFANWVNRLPAQRIGTVDDVASAVGFLASNDSQYMHGSELIVDGGGQA
jgi:glucose 1-dehydrogenase